MSDHHPRSPAQQPARRRRKAALIWIAERLPRWINSDHLSALGLAAMAGAGVSFVMAADGSCCGRDHLWCCACS